MKVFAQLVILMITTGLLRSEDDRQPPADARGHWKDLHAKELLSWEIKKFVGWEVLLDGGSKHFALKSDGDKRFGIIAANPQYWTAEDRKARRQAYFIHHKGKFYRIHPGSNEEKKLVETLKTAAKRLQGRGNRHPKLLEGLAKNLQSRKPLFK
jgi:hypothetical protein